MALFLLSLCSAWELRKFFKYLVLQSIPEFWYAELSAYTLIFLICNRDAVLDFTDISQDIIWVSAYDVPVVIVIQKQENAQK